MTALADTAAHPHPGGTTGRVLTIGAIQADLDQRRLWIGGVQVSLARRRFDVLAVLMDNAGRVMSRGEVYDAIPSHIRTADSAIVRTYVNRLCKSLADHPAALARLRTVHGSGYAFDLDL